MGDTLGDAEGVVRASTRSEREVVAPATDAPLDSAESDFESGTKLRHLPDGLSSRCAKGDVPLFLSLPVGWLPATRPKERVKTVEALGRHWIVWLGAVT